MPSASSEGFTRRMLAHRDPLTEDTPDAEGFLNYAKEHYQKAMELSAQLANNFAERVAGEEHENPILRALLAGEIFQKVAKPLVYLYESWNALPVDVRAKYSPRLRRAREEARSMVEEAFRQGESSKSD